jgi:glycerophosphoryl diester phosphodiesterase
MTSPSDASPISDKLARTLVGPAHRCVTPPPPQRSLRELLQVNDEKALVDRTKPPLVVGHRGAVYQAVENTRESFLFCKEIGCDYVELDVFKVCLL